MIRVIIANYNGEKYLEACLKAVLKQKIKNLELVVVDDASTDGSIKIAKKFHKVELIRLQENGGPARARNRGARGFKGKYLLFLDVDTLLERESLIEAIAEMETDSRIGAGQLDLADHHGHFMSWAGLPYQASGQEKEILGGITAALIVRRDIFAEIGGFDEHYLIYGEDTDLCWRIWLAGYRVVRLTARATHFGKSSFDASRVDYLGARNSVRSILKNAEWYLILPMLLVNGLFWMTMAWWKISRGESAGAGRVMRGWGRGIREARAGILARNKIKRAKDNRTAGVMWGKIGLIELSKKAWRWVSES